MPACIFRPTKVGRTDTGNTCFCSRLPWNLQDVSLTAARSLTGTHCERCERASGCYMCSERQIRMLSVYQLEANRDIFVSPPAPLASLSLQSLPATVYLSRDVSYNSYAARFAAFSPLVSFFSFFFLSPRASATRAIIFRRRRPRPAFVIKRFASGTNVGASARAEKQISGE